jgi:hypothetical protein
MSVRACRLLDLPRIQDSRGNLTVVEGRRHIPFDIRRIYYLTGMPSGSERGGHAHQDLQQLLIAVAGSFDIVLDDGADQVRYHLDRSCTGLYIAPMVWRQLEHFSADSVCLVLASAHYDEADYYRNYAHFLQAVRRKRLSYLLRADTPPGVQPVGSHAVTTQDGFGKLGDW